MTTSTNPFASALEGQKDAAEGQHHTNNPFVSSGTVQSTSSSHNPFLQQQQDQFSQSQEPAMSAAADRPSQYESANQISAQLSGLDFSNSGEQVTTVPSSSFRDFSAGSTNQEGQGIIGGNQASNMDPPAPALQISDELRQQPINQASTVYAAPPGPPPGMLESDAVRGAPGVHHDADEAYARQVLAEEEARVRRNRSGNQATQMGTGSNMTNNMARQNSSPRPIDSNEEKQWNTKEIYWRKRLQRIIIQNENGPCSLIALCNVLLLRGTLRITPEDRPAVSYSYLSSLLGEHLIDIISTSGSDNAMDLEAALSILPQTQYGLDINVKFSSIFGFSVDEAPEMLASADLIDMGGDSSEAATTQMAAKAPTNAERQKQRGELALFKLCNVPLVHGWLADEDDKETWAAVVERSGDYDRALDRVVAGDEAAKGGIVEKKQTNQGGASGGPQLDSLSSDQALVVKDAMLISNFLESTATQLTYPGLYALSTQLQRGLPYALFRNSHLSVLYRPTEEELLQASGESHDAATDAAQPQLYQLVTDSTLEGEDGIVWESVEDVDGSASRFYDGKFKQATASQDFVGKRQSQRGGQVDEDADFAYAQQLQDQESQRARRYQQQNRHRGGNSNRFPLSVYPPNNVHPGSNTTSGTNIISRMLANRKAGKRAPSSNTRLENRVADTTGGLPISSTSQGAPYQAGNERYAPPQDGAAPGEEYTAKKDKWYKKIF